MAKTVLLIGTFDTKGEEFAFVRDQIEANGCSVLLMDIGVLEDPTIAPDISAEEVAQAGGSSLTSLRRQADRTEAFEVMTEGIKKMTPRLYEEGAFDGVLSLGGGSGTMMATAAMRELPLGVPKLMVSSVASGDISAYVDIKDLTFMYSVADIAGLNRLTRNILANAAGAICGMVQRQEVDQKDQPLVAATMFGVTTPCVTRVRGKLEDAGYEVVVFHATGTGGRTMELMIREGLVTGVADVTTTEWCDEVAGGFLSAGPDRLSAAGQAGIPQVVSCGALDMVNFFAPDTVPEKYRSRNLFNHTSTVTLMRTSPEECREIGKRIAGKLNQSTGPTALMIPLKGVSKIDNEGEAFFDPEADKALFDALQEHTNENILLKELNLHINDKEFADAIADQLLTFLNHQQTELNQE
ncbi:Tm-1-like ATP-binding domain-containing protein [Halalkalibaculum sp. DA384]|uniref:Tm-1-like ATP-binding domain-containing protein n=1 Tax=Halalkalibaculum sp. DA384 TaxID=3373606 RepID=UPI003754F58F